MLRRLGRAHDGPPSSAIASIVSRASAWTRGAALVDRLVGASIGSAASLRRGRRVAALRELAAELLGRVSPGSAAASTPASGAGGTGFALLRPRKRPRAAMPTAANQASARFTCTMVSRAPARLGYRGVAPPPCDYEQRLTRLWRDVERHCPSGILCGCFLPHLARAFPCPRLPVRPPEAEGRRQGNCDRLRNSAVAGPRTSPRSPRRRSSLASASWWRRVAARSTRHDVWGKRKLAYEIDKKTDGNYHLLLFSAPSRRRSTRSRACSRSTTTLCVTWRHVVRRGGAAEPLPVGAPASHDAVIDDLAEEDED